MASGSLPNGSEILLFSMAFFGVATWWANNFTERRHWTIICALGGIISASCLLFVVFGGT